MVGVRSLSDEELHAQLLELGITTPVTATTRPLLLKKLMQAKQTRTKAPKAKERTRQSLQAVSSDEEEEEEMQPFAEDEVDEEEEDEDGEELELTSSNKNQSGSRGNNTSGNASLNRSAVFRFNNNSIVTSKNIGHYSKKNRSNTPSHVQARTSTPSSLSNRNLGRTKQAEGSFSGGKLFPSIPARPSPLWKNSQKPTLDYDTASDNEDILNSSTNTSGHSREGDEESESRPNKSNLFSRVTSGIFPSNSNNSSSYRKYTPTRSYSSFRQNDASGGTENGTNFGSKTAYRYGDEDSTDFRRSSYATPFLRQSGSRESNGGWSWTGLSSLFKSSKSTVAGRAYNSGKLSEPKSTTFASIFQRLSPSNKPPHNQQQQQPYPSSQTTISSPATSWSMFGCPGIPAILLLLLFAFFLLLGMSYISMVGPSAQELLKINDRMTGATGGAVAAEKVEWEALAGKEMEKDGLKLPICPPYTESSPSAPCLNQAEVAAASKVLAAGRRLVAEAERRYSEYQCGAHSLGYLAAEEIADWLVEWGNIKVAERAAAVSALAKLCTLNPVLGLEPVYAKNSDNERTQELQGLRIKNPKLHLLCAVMNFATLCLYGLALLGLAGGVFYGVLTLVRTIQHKTHCRKQQMYWLVHEAESLVKGCPEGFMAVQHVRDHLLSPKDRLGEPGKVWRDAEDFIDHHESRVVREVRVVGGEETEVWRWIGQKEAAQSTAVPTSSSSPSAKNASLSSTLPSNSPKNSLYPQLPSLASDDESDATLQRWWQGAGVSRKRSKVQAPTRCLKIRNCPFNQTTPDGLQQELVHRCRGHNIMHMALETDSPEGIVYIMAENAEAAGNIHSLLHGCWFGGLLLSVKFVREERYLERFPNSTRVQNPLRTVSHPGTLTWSQ